MRHVLLPHDYLTYRLTGAYVTDRGDASGTGYWSARENAYRLDLLRVVGRDVDWAPMLPDVLGPLDTRPALDAEASRTAVAAGTGDNMAAALGVALAPGEVAVSVGTSGTAFTVADGPTADPSGAVAGFADAAGRYLPLVCTLNATKVTDAVARLLGVDYAALDALALGASPGANGCTLVPYFDGERTPNRPDATGTITGLRSDVTRGQLARAAFEGVVCGLLDAIDALAAAGVDAGGRIVLVGGGARSAAYRHVLADLAGRSVAVPAVAEHVARGACVQAAAALHGRAAGEVGAAWGLTDRRAIAPDPSVDREAIRAAYAAARG